MGKLILFISLLVLFIGCSKNETPPNFLILIADDASYRDFGSYGNENINTPNIDKLAENGLKFNKAFLTISQCSPSRISILTGKYPHATGAEDLHMPLPEGEVLLPTLLKEKNYYSGLLKKSHLGPNGDSQFDYYSKSLNDFNIFLDSANSQPFFMWVGFTDPHRPYREGIIDNPQGPSKVYVPPYFVDDEDTRNDLADYYNEIMRMDQQIGNYIKTLEKKGLLENTFIVFLSDNGAPFPREKGTVYEAGVRTPLIFTWENGIGQNLNYNQLVSVVDLAPTILDLAGINIPKNMQGESIKKILDDQTAAGRKYIFSERNWHNIDEHIRSVRAERYKLISNSYTEFPHGTAADISNSPTWKSLYENKISGNLTEEQKLLFQVPRPKYELYDVLNDPMELNNLIDSSQHQDNINELKLVLENWQKDTGDFEPTERRRKDNTDRFTGEKFDQTKLPPRL